MNRDDLHDRIANFVAVCSVGAIVALVMLLAAALTGCGSPYHAARSTLATTARFMSAMDREIADARLATSDRVRNDPASTLDQHRAAMAPFEEALAVSLDVRDSLLAAQSAIDAAERGESGEWLGTVACAVAGIQRLYALIVRRELFFPDATVESIVDPLLALGAAQCTAEGAGQ